MATGGARLVVLFLFHGSLLVHILSGSRNLRGIIFDVAALSSMLIVRVNLLQDPDAAFETGLH